MNLKMKKLIANLFTYIKNFIVFFRIKKSLITLILCVVIYASYVYITTDMDDKQAAIVTAQATKVQAVSAIIMLIVTIGLAYLSMLQTQTIQTQINLSLYERRFKIYAALVTLINSILDVELPKQGENIKRFNDDVVSCLQKFWRDSNERAFLLDDNLNQYIESVTKRIREYFTTINKGVIPIYDNEYNLWLADAHQEQAKILSISNEPMEKFKEYLDFRKIQ